MNRTFVKLGQVTLGVLLSVSLIYAILMARQEPAYRATQGEAVVILPRAVIEHSDVYHAQIPGDRIAALVGTVDGSAVDVARRILELDQKDPRKPIYLLINSPGGSVLDGALVISAIEASHAPVFTVCLQLCASMAGIIFEYGTERWVIDRSFLMFHPASGGAEGEVDKMVSRLSSIQKFIGKMERHIATRAGIPFHRYKDLVVNELWLDAQDAVKDHYADKIVSVLQSPGPTPTISSSFSERADTSRWFKLKW